MQDAHDTGAARPRSQRPARLALVLAGLVLSGSGLANPLVSGVRLLPARTWVGLVSVHLEATELLLDDEELTGTYWIRVPLAPWEDDRGLIRLTLAGAPRAFSGGGGRITGSVTSAFNGKTHPVECLLEPDGDVRIMVRTDRRKLDFKTRFEGLAAGADSP